MFSDIYAAVERFGRELNDIRRSAGERETAAKSDLDAETIAFQTRIIAIRERMIQLQQQMKACRQEEDAACEHQTEIEEACEAAVQHRRKVSAFPNTQNMLDFVFGGHPTSSNSASPALSPSAKCSFDLCGDAAGHADDLASIHEKQTPYHPASPASILASLAKRPAEDAPATPGKRLCNVTPATKSIEKTVDFDGLYDNGDAKYKHRIVQYGKEWFILRCDEHNIHFPYRAVTAAGSHLKGYAHNGPSAALPAVIEAFGVRVTGCDKDKAELNNERFKRALDEGYQVLKSAKRHNAPGNMPTDDSNAIEEIVVACPPRSSSLAGVHYTPDRSLTSASLLGDATEPYCEMDDGVDAPERDNCGYKELCEDDRCKAFTAVTDGTTQLVRMERNQQRHSPSEGPGRKEAWNAINRNTEGPVRTPSEQTSSVKTAPIQADGSLGLDQESNAASLGQWWQVIA
ncbi:hypothetical protein CKAH01_18419 [Colletotrichum kahawae]|uniref:Uncharacterized protein n=1 Tax=Colletotrichum kahawae TaxID=34407 RepID=A0AAD9Y6B0_COLKA|nr:hypothetical protein CKAH01_18419 [Colletotrichum kahawae]